MADELGPKAGEPDPNAAPAEGDTDPNVNDQAQDEPEAITALASEMGWKPKDQFGGDPDDWKPATEFIKAGKDIQRSLSKELRGFKDEVSRLSRTTAQIMEDTLTTRLAERDDYWKRVHTDAVDKDNPALAERAVEERIKIASERSKAPTDTGLPAETTAFMERNRAWFGSPTADGRFTGGDPLARMRAMEICDALGKQGIPPDEQLQQAERAVRKEFPDLFPKQAKQPAGVQTGQSRSSNGSGSRAKGYHDMPTESQKVAQDFLERHGVKVEDFAKRYWAEQEGQRRVG